MLENFVSQIESTKRCSIHVFWLHYTDLDVNDDAGYEAEEEFYKIYSKVGREKEIIIIHTTEEGESPRPSEHSQVRHRIVNRKASSTMETNASTSSGRWPYPPTSRTPKTPVQTNHHNNSIQTQTKKKKMQDSGEEQLEEPWSRRTNRRNRIRWSYRLNYRRPRNLEAEIWGCGERRIRQASLREIWE